MPRPSPHTPVLDASGDCTMCPLPLTNAVHHPTPERDTAGRIVASVDTPTVRVGRQHPQTSHDAAAKALPRSGTIRQTIFTLIAGRPDGATDDEIERILERPHQSVSASRNSLMRDNLIEPETTADGEPVLRRTRFGNDATVWVPTRSARALMGADA